MEKVIVYTDGGARGNPGPGAIGVVICDEKNRPIRRYGEYLGPRVTNNEAEYQAVIFALRKLKALFGKKKMKEVPIEVRSDSELLVQQLTGHYKILEPTIQQLFLELWNLKVDFPRIRFAAIPRTKNQEADRLVNEALDSKLKTQALF
jgi:ribonuclease HI